MIGIGIGATFLNNYVAPVLDYVSRIGGLLLINGTMERIREVADEVPAYLVNAVYGYLMWLNKCGRKVPFKAALDAAAR